MTKTTVTVYFKFRLEVMAAFGKMWHSAEFP